MIEMHDYTIDEKYIFEQKTSLIYLKDDRNQNIELSKPAARLLNEIILLNLKKGIATRDELLAKVWEEYGLVGSNNNLNTYISEIRKKLEQIGLDPRSIVTVPKKGFRLDNHISIHENGTIESHSLDNEIIYLHDKYDYYDNLEMLQKTTNDQISIISSAMPIIKVEEHLIEGNINQDINESEIIPLKNNKPRMTSASVNKKNFKLSFLSISTLAVCYLVYFMMQYAPDEKIKQVNNYYTVSSLEKCVIQTPISMADDASKENINLVNNKLKKYNISCKEPKRIILLSDVNKSYSVDKNIALSICKEINEKQDCVSINDQRI